MKKDNYLEVLEEAKELDKRFNFFNTLNERKFNGFPIAVKDNICTKGIKTSAGSRILENFTPTYDAFVVKRLREEGFDVLGKTSMDEFGFGSFSTNTFKIPKNPHDVQRSCGGSSGGSAGYIAASKFAKFAIAQSTGGSISCPASFCGVVGLTPSYGLISRNGLIDFASSLDKIGVVAKSVFYAAKGLSVISGKDNLDMTNVFGNKTDYKKEIGKTEIGNKIAIIKELVGEGVQKEVLKLFWKSVDRLKEIDFKVEEISFPLAEFGIETYYILAFSEASTNLARYYGMNFGISKKIESENFDDFSSIVREEGFGLEAKRRIIMGTLIRMLGYNDKYYMKALKVKRALSLEFERLFSKYDFIISPTMPFVAPKFSEIDKMSAVESYATDKLTVLPNIAGLPHISVPAGLVNDLPVGIQFIGRKCSEQKLLEVAYRYEQSKK